MIKRVVKVLKHLRGTKHYCISLQPPKRWERAKNLELLAFSASAWSGACRPTIGYSLAFMGVPSGSFHKSTTCNIERSGA